MKATLAAVTAGTMLFGFTNLAVAAETEAPGAHSDITIVQSTPGEKSGQATSSPPAASAGDENMDKKDNTGSEDTSNQQAPQSE
jgi:hypothetical protein